MGRLTVALLALLVWAMLIPSPGSAQCGVCLEKAMAGLHMAPEQGESVMDPHDNWTDGMCAGFHEHDPCNPTEEEASLIASLQRGD